MPAAEDTGGYRSAALAERIAREVRWRDVPFTDESDGQRIDPRTLTIALDDLLPAERIVAVDSGNFMGYPSMYLSVPDADGFTFTQAYQSVGLGPQLGDRLGHRPAGPPHGGRAGRRRGADGHQRAGDRGPARPADGHRGLRRRGLRRGGPPLRPGRVPAGHGPVPARRPGRHRPRVRRRGRDRAHPGRPGAGAGLAGRRPGPAAGHRRQGDRRPGLLVAGGGVPRALRTRASRPAISGAGRRPRRPRSRPCPARPGPGR